MAKSDDRLCSNCRAELPRNAEVCPSCGVFTGDVFDGRTDVQKRASRKTLRNVSILLVILAAAAAAWFVFRDSPYVRDGSSRLLEMFHPSPQHETPRFDTGPTRVVSDRPGGERHARGAVLSESEAVRVLRKHLTSTGEKPLKSECLALLSQGSRGSTYFFSAVDSCDHTRLGRWRVDGKTEAVSRATPGD